MKRSIVDSINQNELRELSRLEMENTNGGVFPWAVVATVVGICAGVAYLYDFGYNMVDKAFANAK
jgi:lactobin A/cerein 7B family class IIb bacteriocin